MAKKRACAQTQDEELRQTQPMKPKIYIWPRNNSFDKIEIGDDTLENQKIAVEKAEQMRLETRCQMRASSLGINEPGGPFYYQTKEVVHSTRKL